MSSKSNNLVYTAVVIGLAIFTITNAWVTGASAETERSGEIQPNQSTILDRSAMIANQGPISSTTDFVLFEQPAGEASLIRLMTGGITETTIITGHRPRLSPNGQLIAYLAGDADPIHSDIYVYDLSTETSTRIFENTDSIVYYAWSADSNRIVYDFECYIYAMDPDGSNNQQITAKWPQEHWYSIEYCYNDHPDVNPVDGRLIWENEHYGIAIADADGSNAAWIPNTQPGDFFPRWSPDGQWVAFFHDSDAEDDDNFFKIRPDGSGLTQLTFLAGDNTDEMEQLGGWSADGEFLVGAGEVKGTQAIYAVDADGSGLTVPMLKQMGADGYFVGNAGVLNIDVNAVYIPMVFGQ